MPDDVLHRIGVQIVHRLAVGHRDITGDDFGGIFADAIGGLHRAKPLGIVDVLWDGCGWSVKTVKYAHPSTRKDIRLISGRNDPDYSFGIENPHDDPRKTGEAVLAIWNSRVDKAKTECDELRVIVMIRNIEERVFTLFEEEARRFAPGDFVWEFNKGGNLEGTEIATEEHCFTWQPHGSQFTVIRRIPGSARTFTIGPNVPLVPMDTVLESVKFKPDWVEVQR